MEQIIKGNQPGGLHVVGKVYTLDTDKLKFLGDSKEKISQTIKDNGMTELGSYYHQFEEGFTGVICLAESHIAIHTWPEYNCLTLDVYLCNYSRDNSENSRNLFKQIAEIFNPGDSENIESKEVER